MPLVRFKCRKRRSSCVGVLHILNFPEIDGVQNFAHFEFLEIDGVQNFAHSGCLQAFILSYQLSFVRHVFEY